MADEQEMIMLDTSIWIRYLRPQGWGSLKAEVQRALAGEHILTCWVVKTELLTGTRDKEGFERLRANLQALEDVPLTEAIWEAAARLGQALRLQGFTIPLSDLLIAQAAIKADLLLWHADEHFEQIRRASSLQTRQFLPEQQP